MSPSIGTITLAAWRAELAASRESPWLAGLVLRHATAVARRAAAIHARLAALPRRTRRRLARQWAMALPVAALALAWSGGVAEAATITVGGECALVDAIHAANGDQAVGGCSAGSGADTIVLGGGLYQPASGPFVAEGANAYPSVASDITLQGGGATFENPNVSERRYFHVASGSLRLEDLTIDEGIAIGEGAAGSGGAIFNRGTLVLVNSRISGSLARDRGGAIYGAGPVSLWESELVGNQAMGGGGGIASQGRLTIRKSRLVSNIAGGVAEGGAIESRGYAYIEESELLRNQASAGGAVISHDFLRVGSSEMSGNAALRGGAIANESRAVIGWSLFEGNQTMQDGAAIHNRGDGLHLYHSTLTGNRTIQGRGVIVDETAAYDGVAIGDCTLVDNDGGRAGAIVGAVGLISSIVTGSVAPLDCTQLSGRNNLIDGDGSRGCEAIRLGEISGLERTLGQHGGKTSTFALDPVSNAIDVAGECSRLEDDVPVMDQRGVPRPVDGDGDGIAACDVGAYELARLFRLEVELSGAAEGRVRAAGFLEDGIDCGRAGGDCEETYAEGMRAYLRAEHDAGAQVFWEGDCDARGQVEMTGERRCVARFEPRPPGVPVYFPAALKE